MDLVGEAECQVEDQVDPLEVEVETQVIDTRGAESLSLGTLGRLPGLNL